MRRMILIALATAPALLAGVASTAPAASPPRASLHAFVCQRALDPPSRGISVQSVMRPIQGTERLAVRFALLVTQAGETSLQRGGDLGMWISPSDPTLGQRVADVWQLTKAVANLAAPADYRFKVSFRWIGAHGRIIGRAERQTPPCHQPELRPDLLVESIAVAPVLGRPSVDVYIATVANGGAGATGPFEVGFAAGDGSAPKLRNVRSLGPHATVQVRFRGPACDPADPPTITADPAAQVDDLDRSNNSLTATCAAN
jgi:CARDB